MVSRQHLLQPRIDRHGNFVFEQLQVLPFPDLQEYVFVKSLIVTGDLVVVMTAWKKALSVSRPQSNLWDQERLIPQQTVAISIQTDNRLEGHVEASLLGGKEHKSLSFDF